MRTVTHQSETSYVYLIYYMKRSLKYTKNQNDIRIVIWKGEWLYHQKSYEPIKNTILFKLIIQWYEIFVTILDRNNSFPSIGFSMLRVLSFFKNWIQCFPVVSKFEYSVLKNFYTMKSLYNYLKKDNLFWPENPVLKIINERFWMFVISLSPFTDQFEHERLMFWQVF